MRTTKIALAVTLVALSTLVSLTPAHAGGWALTYLDTIDERVTMQPSTQYTITYWVLQHGNHPTEGDLGVTGLRFTSTNGEQVLFEGAPLGEPAHFRVQVRLPATGLWRVTAVQGVFADYELGLLSLPGRLAAYPVTPPSNVSHDGHSTHWGAVRPPGFCDDSHAPATTPSAPVLQAATAPQPPRSDTARTAAGVGIVILAALGVAFGLARRRG